MRTRAELTEIEVFCDLESAGGRAPERVVDLVDDVGGAENATGEAASVKTLKCFLTASNSVKLDVNITFAVSVDGEMNDLAVLLGTFDLDLFLE